jgi:ribosome-binding protein aMBF1 (putative translation factor)
MTEQQCKSARYLLGWSRAQLSERVGGRPSANSIRNYERQWKKLQPGDLAVIRAEFENAGIEFDVDGLKVQLHRR